MDPNPFRQPAAAEAPAPEAGAPEADVLTPEAALEVEAEETFGKFEEPKPEKVADAPIPKKRFNKVIGERNELREALAVKEAELASALSRADTLGEVLSVVNAKYAENPQLLEADATFMETFAELAKQDARAAQVAQQILNLMQNGEKTTMATSDQTPEVEEVAEEVAPAIEPAVEKILTRDVTRTFTEVLGGHGVKPNYIEAITRDVLSTLSVTEVADATPEEIVEMAKHYLTETKTPFEEALLPQKGKSRPDTASGRSAPTRAPVARDEHGEPERVKPKTVDEWEANRNKRFAALTRELNLNR